MGVSEVSGAFDRAAGQLAELVTSVSGCSCACSDSVAMALAINRAASNMRNAAHLAGKLTGCGGCDGYADGAIAAIEKKMAEFSQRPQPVNAVCFWCGKDLGNASRDEVVAHMMECDENPIIDSLESARMGLVMAVMIPQGVIPFGHEDDYRAGLKLLESLGNETDELPEDSEDPRQQPAERAKE